MGLTGVPNNILSQFLARPVDRYGIGRNNRNTTLKSTQMGDTAIAQSDGACAIGSGSLALDRSSLAIGLNATARSANGVALGEQAQSIGVNSIVVGAKSQAPYPNSIAIGPSVQTKVPNEMRIGDSQGTRIKLRVSDMVQFLELDASSPGLKANGVALQVRLANDSAFTELDAGLIRAMDPLTGTASIDIQHDGIAATIMGTLGHLQIGNAADDIILLFINGVDAWHINDTAAKFSFAPSINAFSDIGIPATNEVNNIYVKDAVVSDAVQFGGKTASFPELKANSTTIRARLADDSAYTAVEVLDEVYNAANWNGKVEVPTKNAVRDELELRMPGVTAHTVPLAKLTGGGANGSITVNAYGIVTAYVDPT